MTSSLTEISLAISEFSIEEPIAREFRSQPEIFRKNRATLRNDRSTFLAHCNFSGDRQFFTWKRVISLSRDFSPKIVSWNDRSVFLAHCNFSGDRQFFTWKRVDRSRMLFRFREIFRQKSSRETIDRFSSLTVISLAIDWPETGTSYSWYSIEIDCVGRWIPRSIKARVSLLRDERTYTERIFTNVAAVGGCCRIFDRCSPIARSPASARFHFPIFRVRCAEILSTVRWTGEILLSTTCRQRDEEWLDVRSSWCKHTVEKGIRWCPLSLSFFSCKFFRFLSVLFSKTHLTSIR